MSVYPSALHCLSEYSFVCLSDCLSILLLMYRQFFLFCRLARTMSVLYPRSRAKKVELFDCVSFIKNPLGSGAKTLTRRANVTVTQILLFLNPHVRLLRIRILKVFTT